MHFKIQPFRQTTLHLCDPVTWYTAANTRHVNGPFGTDCVLRAMLHLDASINLRLHLWSYDDYNSWKYYEFNVSMETLKAKLLEKTQRTNDWLRMMLDGEERNQSVWEVSGHADNAGLLALDIDLIKQKRKSFGQRHDMMFRQPHPFPLS